MLCKLIVFSRDRAAQCDLLLRSVAKNCPGLFDVSVLFKSTTKEFSSGYHRLKERHPDIDFVNEIEDFQTETIKLVAASPKSFLAFAADDNVIYSEWPSNVGYDEFMPDTATTTSSLRLGLNTLVQDCHRGIMQPALNLYSRKGEMLYWDCMWYHGLHNYGYPLALDFHIFDREKILWLISRFGWNNSNSLEGGLQQFRSEVRFIKSLKKSISVNIPCNNLSQFTQSNVLYPYPNELLNRKWLADQYISLEAISRADVRGCHQDIEFEFVQMGS